MGIKHFFSWFRKNYPETIETHNTTHHSTLDREIDTLALDLNGIFHPSAQKIFQYGAHKPMIRLLRKTDTIPYSTLEKRFCQHVCKTIEDLVTYVGPKKRLFLCVDGVAGSSKQSQQRSRRFKSASENSDCDFDSCSITPGTELMHNLNSHIDYYIRKRIHESNRWKNLQVIFSSEKVPGEGEHKAKQLFKRYGSDEERYCIFGLDADLIMLSLAVKRPNMYILRENMYVKNEMYFIDIGLFGKQLQRDLGTEKSTDDFILLCFLMGNDFLPNIPSLEIITGGIPTILLVYKKMCRPYGILTKDADIRFDVFQQFLQGCAEIEIESLFEKYRQRDKYFPDPLMNAFFGEDKSCVVDNQHPIEVDFDAYRERYYKEHFPENVSVETICHEYLYGMQWIAHYYIKKIPSWNWSYPYHYAPFLCDLQQYCETMCSVVYPSTAPSAPFQQLLSVLPPQSKGLLPKALGKLTTSDQSPLIEFYPKNFEIDLAGKRQEWEGLVKIPMIDMNKLNRVYKSCVSTFTDREKRRNKTDKEVTYEYVRDRDFHFKSRYAHIEQCHVYTKYL